MPTSQKSTIKGINLSAKPTNPTGCARLKEKRMSNCKICYTQGSFGALKRHPPKIHSHLCTSKGSRGEGNEKSRQRNVEKDRIDRRRRRRRRLHNSHVE